MSKKNNAPQLSRTMSAGQMEMISLGGAIGVGLFMGSTSTIKWTGPSVLLAYMFVGLIFVHCHESSRGNALCQSRYWFFC